MEKWAHFWGETRSIDEVEVKCFRCVSGAGPSGCEEKVDLGLTRMVDVLRRGKRGDE